MKPIIQLYCETGPEGGNFTSLKDILANPKLIDPDEWIDFENGQLLAPYGALEITLPLVAEPLFSHGAEDIEDYASFLTNSLYATQEGGIPDHRTPYLRTESFLGFKSVVAKIWEQENRYILLQVEADELTLISIDSKSQVEKTKVDIETWRFAAKAALQTLSLFYQQVVLPAFRSSPLRDEIALDHGINSMSMDIANFLGSEYSFSGLGSGES